MEQRARAALAMLRPDLRDGEQINDLIAQLRQNAGRTFLETLISDRISNSTRVQAADPSALAEILQDRRPVIFVTVHTANLGDTMGGALLALTGRHGTTVTRPFLNRFRQRLSVKLRPRANAAILPPGSAPLGNCYASCNGPTLSCSSIWTKRAASKSIFQRLAGRYPMAETSP